MSILCKEQPVGDSLREMERWLGEKLVRTLWTLYEDRSPREEQEEGVVT